MRTVEEIKADIACAAPTFPVSLTGAAAGVYDIELRAALTAGISLDMLGPFCDAIREGRAVVLPCKPGDTVYMFEPDYDESMGCFRSTQHAEEYPFSIDMLPYIGESIFLTRASAEAAMQKGE